MLLLADEEEVLQFLLNIAVDNSILEKYLLQPVKSVLLYILNVAMRRSTTEVKPHVITKGEPMPVVNETMHMGMLCSNDTQETAVSQNITKTQRTLYSLMASGLHGENGLDPETSIHLLQIYVLSVMVYGLDVVLPKPALVDKLNRTYKKILKQILSLPITVADPAVYILSGALPMEGIIHKRTLILYGSICRLDESSVEKCLARRQQAIKGPGSYSWYVELKKILIKYDLPCCWDLLDNPMKKEHWKRLVNKKVNKFWSTRIKQSAELYPSLKYLTADDYWPGQKHPLIQQVNGTRDIPHVNTRLKLVTGAYITQSNRATFNHVPVDPTCMLCQQKPETIEHILTECKALEDTRRPILETFITECNKSTASTA